MLRLLLASSLLAAAPGKLIINGTAIPLNHVYARTAPNAFEKDKVSTYILATDVELSPAERVDEDAIRIAGWEGKMNAVEIELTSGGISWTILSKKARSTLSGSQSPSPYQITVAAGRATGQVKMKEPSTLGETTYYFEFPIDAPIESKAPVKPPTAAETAAAQNAASTKVYKLFQAAVRSGDKAGIIKHLDPAKAKQVDTPDFPEMLKFIQSMQPKKIDVLRTVETGDQAELTVSAEAQSGTVKMQRINGNWVVMRESWKKN